MLANFLMVMILNVNFERSSKIVDPCSSMVLYLEVLFQGNVVICDP